MLIITWILIMDPDFCFHCNYSLQSCAVLPLRKFYTEKMFVLLRTKRIQLRNHADTQIVKRSQR